MGSTRKLLHYLLRGRFGPIFRAIGERWPRSLLYHGRAFMFELTERPKEPPPDLPEGYACGLAEPEHLPALTRITGLPVEEYERRMERGELCFCVFNGATPVNLNWIHQGSCYVRGMGFLHKVDSRHSYIYGIMTDQSQRGKKLYQKSLRHLAAFLFDRGATCLVQMAERDNAPVLHTLPKLGYTKTTMISHFCLLGLKCTTVTDLVDRKKKRYLFVKHPTDEFII
jgi:ribosomal protein S18 acetylase RimI-like enzyme